jgi:paired amphipathic helix protein Sin3a
LTSLQRQKITAQRPPQPEGPVVSPTLIPQLPEPLPPLPALPTTQEELGFFDRAKKHIGNRASYAEFLKLINLYSNDLVDKYTLMDRVGAFVGSNTDLMIWFNNFLGTEEQDDTMDGRLRPDPGRVNLSHCRALGPSYRHLPKRDQNRSCKGRDGMCHEVLNDVWASHPTWASEDSGFVAHRKNQYEEALHRIEEERHDYDFHIESCHRTIQLMEPLVQQINAMSDADRANFQLQPGLGGASEAIPKRIIMKIYDREFGAKIMTDMFLQPVKVLPIILRRLKQKLEEWKQVQREWEKLWREQIHKQFWKSLDHQGINAKNLDKKNFQQKTLLSEIQAKYEEQKKNRDMGFSQPKHQLEYEFNSPEVILDAARLVLVGLDTDRGNYSSSDQSKIRNFFLDFVPKFFGMEREQFDHLLSDDRDQARSNDEMDEDQLSDHRPLPRTKSKGKKANSLHRSVVDRGNGRDDSVASGSKESTPTPLDTGDVDMISDAALESASIDAPPKQWIKHASDPIHNVRLVKLDESYPHTTFNLYANANIYQFFRLYEMLYTRLLAIKQNEANVHEAVSRYKGEGHGPKPAIELHMIDKGPEDFFAHTDVNADYYSQILQMCEMVISGHWEMTHLEDTLRRYYNQTGWQLYTVDKLVAAIIRCMFNVMSSDAKDKSLDISNLFLRDRERPDTTRAQEIQYRKQVEKFSKDGEVYRISYVGAH